MTIRIRLGITRTSWITLLVLTVSALPAAAATKVSVTDEAEPAAAEWTKGAARGASYTARPAKTSLDLWQDDELLDSEILDGSGPAVATCCDTCDAENPWCSPTWYGRADLLIWWTKGTRVPALVTTSPDDTLREDAGVIGVEGTRILHGDGLVDGNYRPGARITLGHWLDRCRCTGLEVTWFTLGDGANSGNFFAESVGDPLSPILARPYFDVLTDENSSELVAFPDVIEGSVQTLSGSEMHSVALSLRQNWWTSRRSRLDLVGGYRFWRYREGLSITEHLTSTDPGGTVAQGTTIDLVDAFETRSEFHGGELGVAAVIDRGCWSVDVLTKLAFGNMHQHVNIDGATVVTAPDADPDIRRGGFLALSTNIGEESRDRFALIPELNLNVQYHLSESLSLSAGYSLLWITEVARAGDQIDPRVNTSYLPDSVVTPTGPELPARLMGDSSMWAQGLNLGAVWQF